MRERFKYIRPIFIFTFSILVIGLVLMYSQYKASADAYSWTSGSLTSQTRDDMTSNPGHITYGWCTNQKVTYSAPWFVQDPTTQACVFTAQSFRYAIFSTNWGSGLFVSIGSDQKMYHVNNLGYASANNVRPSPNTNDFIFGSTVWKDVPSKLMRIVGTYGEFSYDPTEFPTYMSFDEQNQLHNTYATSVSRNGEWEIANVENLGYVRVHLKDLTVKWIAPFQSSYEAATISNDGRFVAVTSYGIGTRPPTVFDINDCGQSAAIIQSSWFGTTLSNPCASRDLTDTINTTLGVSNFTIEGEPEFSDDGWQLTLFTRPNGAGGKGVELNAAGYTPPRLDYLALGDSYSSGEGDIDKKFDGTSYYTSATNYAGGCHVSERSYPFRFSSWMNIAFGKMQSVACSGAEINDMKLRGTDYLGQGNRLKDLTTSQLAISRQEAIDSFIPGRIAQIEYVKTYRPKTVTLTGGGNDVDFGGKLVLCAKGEDSCKWSTDRGRAQLGYEIKKEFYELKDFYQELKLSSPQTKIYVVGYPLFINPDPLRVCFLDGGHLSTAEKIMLDEATKYMNMTIKAAAQAAGVVYLDVEASLEGGRICDFGGEYITGLWDIGLFNEQEYYQTFHPNALGHQKMSESMRNQLQNYNLLTYPYLQIEDNTTGPPTYSDYFNDVMTTYQDENGATHRSFTTSDTIRGEPNDIYVDDYSFQGGSVVTEVIYSEPLTIGQLTADSDGSVNGSFTIPTSLSAGYHTLELRGKSYSGEQIAIEQTILIRGNNPDDIDDNGTPDSLQLCGPFLPWSNIDIDLDGIDDACDPYTQNHRPIYQVRSGDSARSYQSAAENNNYLYLERNVHASNFSGVGGDYDLDGDGFSIIAASQGSVPSGHYSNLQINTSIMPNSVYLSFRTAENGCVQYKPTDLSRVTPSLDYRTFTQHATNTNTCRSQPVIEDLDGNGQADSTQPLYVGRNGDPTKGEIVTKIYLFRSTQAAEAQLGISDYAPLITSAPNPIPVDSTTDYRQPWSLMASTQSNPLLAVTYQSIHMVANTPYVIVKTNIGGLCQAYKPATTATIKQSTQPTVNLSLDLQQTLNAQLGTWCG